MENAGNQYNEHLVPQNNQPQYQQPQYPPQNLPPVTYGNPYQQPQYQQPQYPPQYPPQYQQPAPMIIQTMPPQQPEKPCGAMECRGKYPQQFYCVTCRKNLVSRVETSWGIGSCVWCMCCGVTVVIALLPCCIDGLRDVKHSCPLCQRTVGNEPCCC